ncbi:siderophore-iron reductase FhuF [Ancylobacter sp. A5.8]|uniref:siderophore-iron reductase FhuF n=1 Tax=Ancylobacter gelatini TaxID=2919920 RepID=UPI001F4EA25E|nr:siderophore-iron reductase FhuF [Ancylobacter gelatini]MCJ8145106.1 siderophore-iron reductase FhuF [Ancylobacter gelatini]
MIPELSSAFPAGLEHHAQSVSLIDNGRPSVPGRCFLERDTLSTALLRLRPRYPRASVPVLAVLWAKMYGFRIIAASLPPALLLDWQLPVALDEASMALDPEDGCAACLHIPHVGSRASSADPFERLQGSIRHHLDPVLEAVSLHMKAPITALRGDAAVNFHHIASEVTQAAARAGRPLGCDVGRLSTAKTWPDGKANTLHAPFLPRESCSGHKTRRTCCLHYRASEDGSFCATCPVAEKHLRMSHRMSHLCPEGLKR